MPSAKFPINVNLESTDGDVDRAKIVNGYAEVASANEVKVYSRPALTLVQGSFAAFGQGIANTPTGQLFVVSGGEYYIPVPGGTTTSIATFSVSGNSFFLYRAFGNFIYALGGGTAQPVYRAAPPFTTFGSVGQVSTDGSVLRDAIVHNGTFYTRGTLGNLYRTANGTAWSVTSNAPTAGFYRFFSMGGTFFAYPPTIQGTTTYQYSTNNGDDWLSGTSTASATLTDFLTGPVFDSKLWAVTGTGTAAAQDDVLSTSDGNTWVTVSSDVGFNTPARDPGNTFAVNDGVMYVATHDDTDYQVWASSDYGVTWTQVTTAALGSVATRFTALSIGGNVYVVLPSSAAAQRLFRLTSDNTLQGVTSKGFLDIPNGEIATVISTEAGTTFIKTTTAAYTISSGVATKVSDAQYPTTTVRGAVYLNGRLFVMEPDGTIWSSAEDDFSSWAGTDFVSAEFEADGGVCLAKQGEYVIALGQFTTEAFFFDGTITAGAPLSPVGSAVMLIGCAHANSVAQVESSLVWVAQQKGQGSTFHKGRFVVIMKGYGSYERISSPDVERVLDKDAFVEVYADILTVAGHVFYVLTLTDSDVTLAYDFRSQLWYDWTLQTVQAAQAITSITGASQLATAILASHGYNDGDQVVVTGGTGTFTAANGTYNVNVVNSGTFTYPIGSSFSGTCTTGTGQGWTSGALDISASCYFNNEQLVQLRETGDVYALEGTGVSDNGAPIDFRIRTRNWDGGTNREKFMGSLEVVGDKVSSTGLVRYTDDDFQTYTRYKRVTLSLRRPRSRRGGSFSRRAVEFRHTLSAKVGISALEADIEMGEQ